MTHESALDRAHRAMEAAPEDEAARLAYYRAFADAELCLLLEREPEGDDLAPRLVALDSGRAVLAFDGEERLAAFSDLPLPYAALPGRVIAQALAGQGAAIGVNLAGGPGAFLMPAEAVDWLADALARRPSVVAAEPVAWHAPARPDLAARLADRLAGFGALAARAWLAGAAHADGRKALTLVFEDAAPGAEEALAKAAAEALLFSPLHGEPVDLTFLGGARTAALNLAGLAAPVPLSRPAPAPVATPLPAAPGTDPDRPPRLR
jgi:hypothetical protein